MPPVPTIRIARVEDADDLARLRWDMRLEELEPVIEFGVLVEQFRRFVEKTVGRGTWRVWVAELDGSPVANLWLQLVERVPRPDAAEASRIGYLTNVYVEEAHRNEGLGSAMLDQVLDWARGEGLGLLIVWPSERSVPYYRRAGFEPSTDAMVMRISHDA